MNVFVVVSDSVTLPKESSFFTSIGKLFLVECIRTSTERSEELGKDNFVLLGIEGNALLHAAETTAEMNRGGDHGIPMPDYLDENVSVKAVKIIEGYTGAVNKMVRRK